MQSVCIKYSCTHTHSTRITTTITVITNRFPASLSLFSGVQTRPNSRAAVTQRWSHAEERKRPRWLGNNDRGLANILYHSKEVALVGTQNTLNCNTALEIPHCRNFNALRVSHACVRQGADIQRIRVHLCTHTRMLAARCTHSSECAVTQGQASTGL
jgi:hypothetical protein